MQLIFVLVVGTDGVLSEGNKDCLILLRPFLSSPVINGDGSLCSICSTSPNQIVGSIQIN